MKYKQVLTKTNGLKNEFYIEEISHFGIPDSTPERRRRSAGKIEMWMRA